MNCSGRCLPSDLPVNRGRQRPDRQPRWCRSTGNCGSGIPGRAGTWTGSPSRKNCSRWSWPCWNITNSSCRRPSIPSLDRNAGNYTRWCWTVGSSRAGRVVRSPGAVMELGDWPGAGSDAEGQGLGQTGGPSASEEQAIGRGVLQVLAKSVPLRREGGR